MNYTGTNKEYTGKGQGVYNTVAGSLGLASFLGLGGSNNRCGNGGILNLGNDDNCCYETKSEAVLRTQLAIAEANAKTAETSKADLERFYTVTRQTDEKIADGLIQTGNALGVLTARVDCLEKMVERNREESFRNLAEAKEFTRDKVETEAAIRSGDIDKLTVYTKQRFNTVDVQLDSKVSYSKRLSSSILCDDGCDCA